MVKSLFLSLLLYAGCISAFSKQSPYREQKTVTPRVREKVVVRDEAKVIISVPHIQNGDFEKGDLTGWRVEGPHKAAISTETPDGSKFALHIHIGEGHSCQKNVSASPQRWLKVYQKVFIPEQAKYLSFYAKVEGRTWHEPIRIFIQEEGSLPAIVWSWGSGRGRGMHYAWTYHLIDITPIRGKSLILGFVGANWNGFSDHITDIYIDNVGFLDENMMGIDTSGLYSIVELRNEVEELVKQLSDEDWHIRENATRRLLKIGLPVLPFIKKALGSGDEEVRYRAERILNCLSVRLSSMKMDDG